VKASFQIAKCPVVIRTWYLTNSFHIQSVASVETFQWPFFIIDGLGRGSADSVLNNHFLVLRNLQLDDCTLRNLLRISKLEQLLKLTGTCFTTIALRVIISYNICISHLNTIYILLSARNICKGPIILHDL